MWKNSFKLYVCYKYKTITNSFYILRVVISTEFENHLQFFFYILYFFNNISFFFRCIADCMYFILSTKKKSSFFSKQNDIFYE